MSETSTHIVVAALWGMAVIISWLGFGAIIDCFFWRRNTKEARHAPVGLLAGWGMATFICLGGLFLWLHIAMRFTLVLLTVAGALMWIWELWRRRADIRNKWGTANLRWLIDLPFVILLLIIYAGGMQRIQVSIENDDLPAYLPFTHEILQTGGLVQPFSLRRIVSYSGHSLLQAQVLSGTSDAYHSFLEKGLCPILICLLMLFLISPSGIKGRVLAYTVITVLLLMGMPSTNSFCLATGVVMFLTLFATLEYGEKNYCDYEVKNSGYWITLGLISSAAIALRVNFLPGIALTLLLYFLVSVVGNRIGLQQLLKGGILLGGTALLTLVPWALAQWESSRTPLYPLINGNYRETGIFSDRMPVSSTLRYFVFWLVPKYVWPELLGIVLCITRRTAQIGIPFYISAIVMSLLTKHVNPLGSPIHDFRYSFPMLFAAELGLIGLTLQPQFKRSMRIICIAVVLVIAAANAKMIARGLYINLHGIATAASAHPFVAKQTVEEYRQAQQVIPQGERILVMTYYPHLFDYSRNKVELIDIPGACSPDPGMPMFSNETELKNYLLKQGIKYIIHDNFDIAPGFYSRARIQDTEKRKDAQDRILSKHIDYVMNSFDSMGRTGYIIGRYGSLIVLHIQ